MINNRQQSGRRRGRGQGGQGGPRQGGGRGPESGNRIDNRARGNAPQLHEKYKTLARDAQQSGDRVLTEYYLQFADHYFRVMSESRVRFEENQAQRQQRDFSGEDIGFEGEDGDESDITDDFDQRMPGQQPQPQSQQRYGRDRDDNRPVNRQDGRQDNRNEGRQEPRQDRPYRDRDDNRPRRDYEDRRPNGNGYDGNRAERPAPREDRTPMMSERDDAPEPATLSLDVLPPSFAIETPAVASEDAPAPRRRGRPRKDATATAPPADA